VKFSLQLGESPELTFLPITREIEVTHGYGKKKYTEKVITTLGAVPDLLTCDWFNPEGSKANTSQYNQERLRTYPFKRSGC